MKTAEEWYSTEYFDVADVNKDTFINICKQIQLEAMKEGMRRAAAMVETMDEDVSKMPSIINMASEQLTEKDL